MRATRQTTPACRKLATENKRYRQKDRKPFKEVYDIKNIIYIIISLCKQKMSRLSCAAVYHKSILLSLSTVLLQAELSPGSAHQAAPPHSTEQTTDLK